MTTQVLRKQSLEGLKGSTSHFFFHRDRIEKEIAKSIASFGDKTKLRDACEYALTNGGKRFRPLIVLMIAEALGNGLNVADAAMSVEFFHTASLIADDLPCMDNDEERRNKPTLHKVYGEAIALLASYALITAAFEKIKDAAVALKNSGPPFSHLADRACVIGLDCAAKCAGISGATGGQFWDLFPPNQTLETVKEVIIKKTVTLFEVSFVFGWIFGGGDMQKVEEVKELGYHLGMAFQIVDDIDDLKQDEKNQKCISLARLIGKERSMNLFDEEMALFTQKLRNLELYTPSFAKMADLLNKRAFLAAQSSEI